MPFNSALITGASGFLGRALAAHLNALGKHVVVCGRPGWSVLPQAARQLRIARPSPGALKAALSSQSVDVVFHCAGYGVRPDLREPGEMFRANVADIGNWVEAAVAIGAKAIVHTGSCSEYGRVHADIPITEDVPLAASDLYGASKAAGGQWGRAVAQRHGIAFQWLRVFGVYGAGELPHRLLPYLYARLSAHQRVDLTLGEQRRDFLLVDDAVRGIALAADAALEGRIGPFNLCSGIAVTVRAFAECVAETVGNGALSLLDFGTRPYRPDEQPWMVGDPSRFAAATHFQPKTDLRTGITHTLRAIEQHQSKVM